MTSTLKARVDWFEYVLTTSKFAKKKASKDALVGLHSHTVCGHIVDGPPVSDERREHPELLLPLSSKSKQLRA
jgi:hypothetical protein